MENFGGKKQTSTTIIMDHSNNIRHFLTACLVLVEEIYKFPLALGVTLFRMSEF